MLRLGAAPGPLPRAIPTGPFPRSCPPLPGPAGMFPRLPGVSAPGRTPPPLVGFFLDSAKGAAPIPSCARRRQRTACPWTLPGWHGITGTARGWLEAAGSALPSSRRFGPGKSRLETSALRGPSGPPGLGAGTRSRESGRPGHRAAPPDRPRGVRRAGLEPGPAWPGGEAGQQVGHGRSGPGMTGVRPGPAPAGRRTGPAATLAPRACSPGAPGGLLPAVPRGAGRARPALPPGRAPFASGSRCGSRCGARAQGAAAPDAVGGREPRTMRPAHNCAARVGPGGARVAECVCVRLSVNPDRPPPIG